MPDTKSGTGSLPEETAGTARLILPVVITAIVLVVSVVVSVFNLKDARDFVPPLPLIAAVTAFLAIPAARNVTLSIVGLIARTA